jgi:callose synthase
VFANYRKWCAHLDVRPQFAGPPDPADPGRVGGRAADLLLWFFVWGEAANLRHMPESLCFLYHKCMQSWKARAGHALEGGQRYPGHFLDHTIAPIYDVLKRASAAKKVRVFTCSGVATYFFK